MTFHFEELTMKIIIKYRAPFFRGNLPYRMLRAFQYDNSPSTYLHFDQYGRTFILSGPLAPEVAGALVKAFGGQFETISLGSKTVPASAAGFP